MKDSPSSLPDPQPPAPDAWFGEFLSHSPEETFALAKQIGEQVKGGEVFLLRGELGAGKTVFAKGLAAGLGIAPADVTSPSFTLINVHQGRLRFYHVDLFRLERGSHDDLGLQEIFDDDRAVTAIEWAERLSGFPARAIDVELARVSECARKINIAGPGD